MILAKLLLQAPIRYGLVAWAKTQSFGIFLKFAHLEFLPSIVIVSFAADLEVDSFHED